MIDPTIRQSRGEYGEQAESEVKPEPEPQALTDLFARAFRQPEWAMVLQPED